MVNIEKSKEVKLFVNHDTKSLKVQTSLSSSVFVRFPKSGTQQDSTNSNDYILAPVLEIFEANVVND